MFEAVHFHSYKCLADVSLELGRMTLLVGANASGKSNLLGFMAWRAPTVGGPAFVLVDGNRLTEASPALYGGIRLATLGLPDGEGEGLAAIAAGEGSVGVTQR